MLKSLNQYLFFNHGLMGIPHFQCVPRNEFGIGGIGIGFMALLRLYSRLSSCQTCYALLQSMAHLNWKQMSHSFTDLRSPSVPSTLKLVYGLNRQSSQASSLGSPGTNILSPLPNPLNLPDSLHGIHEMVLG